MNISNLDKAIGLHKKIKYWKTLLKQIDKVNFLYFSIAKEITKTEKAVIKGIIKNNIETKIKKTQNQILGL
jgi:hypothetical protein